MNPVIQIKAYFDALDRYDKEEANREEILRTAWLIGKEARDLYLHTAAAEGWSSHELRRRVRYRYYENWRDARIKGHQKMLAKSSILIYALFSKPAAPLSQDMRNPAGLPFRGGAYAV